MVTSSLFFLSRAYIRQHDVKTQCTAMGIANRYLLATPRTTLRTHSFLPTISSPSIFEIFNNYLSVRWKQRHGNILYAADRISNTQIRYVSNDVFSSSDKIESKHSFLSSEEYNRVRHKHNLCLLPPLKNYPRYLTFSTVFVTFEYI